MRLYNHQEIKNIYDSVNDVKDFWRVTNLLINICEEYPEQKTMYLYSISIQKFRKLTEELNFELDKPISWKKLKEIIVQHTKVERFKTYVKNRTQKEWVIWSSLLWHTNA